MRVVVIGAGPAGLTAALELVRGGAEVSVFEAGDVTGGMARSFELWGRRVDLGPHRFFSNHPRVNRLWFDVVGDRFETVTRLTRIYYGGHFYAYPLKPWDVALQAGPLRTLGYLSSYLRERLRGSDEGDDSFESWVVRRFGRRLFEAFFRPYSEKLWGIPCNQLSGDFAAQRIRTFSLGAALSAAVSPRRAREHRTLVDRFAYPHGGTGAVYEKMTELIHQLGGTVRLRAPVKRVLQSGADVCGIELADGTQRQADHVVSTMPLPLLVRGLSDVPPEVCDAADSLRFRSTLLVYLHVNRSDLFGDQWLYIHAPELATGRVTNFNNWCALPGQASPTTILAAEFWSNEGDSRWRQSDAELIALAEVELRKIGLLGDAKVLAGHVERVARCYPVYRLGYHQHVVALATYLRRIRGLSVIGRYGAFKYNNQDHSILMGILAAENVLHERKHDLWSVNADYDVYQEPPAKGAGDSLLERGLATTLRG